MQQLVKTRKLPEEAINHWQQIQTPRLKKMVEHNYEHNFATICSANTDDYLTIALVAARDMIVNCGCDQVFVLDSKSRTQDFHDAATKRALVVTVDTQNIKDHEGIWSVSRRMKGALHSDMATLFAFSTSKAKVLSTGLYDKLLDHKRCISLQELITKPVGELLAALAAELKLASNYHFEILELDNNIGWLEVFNDLNLLCRARLNLQEQSFQFNHERLQLNDPEFVRKLKDIISTL